MKFIKIILFSIIVFTMNTINAAESVNCQDYALDQMDNIEAHFGCFDDAATYNLVAAEIIRLCEAMDQ